MCLFRINKYNKALQIQGVLFHLMLSLGYVELITTAIHVTLIKTRLTTSRRFPKVSHSSSWRMDDPLARRE